MSALKSTQERKCVEMRYILDYMHSSTILSGWHCWANRGREKFPFTSDISVCYLLFTFNFLMPCSFIRLSRLLARLTLKMGRLRSTVMTFDLSAWMFCGKDWPLYPKTARCSLGHCVTICKNLGLTLSLSFN